MTLPKKTNTRTPKKVVERKENVFPIDKEIDLRTIKVSINFMNPNQEKLYKSIKRNELTICIGYPGTAKTYISCATALQLLLNQENEYDKIYLIKSVTALEGEEIGFLKGTLEEKMDPFLMSFKMNMNKIVESEVVNQLFKNKKVEVLPLAYIRGINLDNCMLDGSLILLSNGEQIKVEDLYDLYLNQIDDENSIDLKSYNLETFEIENKPLTALAKVPLTKEDEVFEIELEYGRVLKLTSNHKLFVEGNVVVQVKDLKIETKLLTKNDNCLILQKIKSIRKMDFEEYKDNNRYSFNVEDNHNYFVDNILSKNCIIIADETQNLNRFNFKTLLTRIGKNAKMVVLGDTKQIDLKDKNKSVLKDIYDMFDNVDGIGRIEFTKDDIVRNPLVNLIETKFEEKWNI